MILFFAVLLATAVATYQFNLWRIKKQKEKEDFEPEHYRRHDIITTADFYDHYGNSFHLNQDVYLINPDGEIGLYFVANITHDGLLDWIYHFAYKDGATPHLNEGVKFIVVDPNFRERKEGEEPKSKYRSIDAIPFSEV